MKLKDLNSIKPQTVIKTIFVPLLCGLIGAFIAIYVMKNLENNSNAKIKSFYEAEMATVVSPSTLKKMVDNKDTSYILVDLRSAGEYNKEHFIDAINIPAGSMNTEELVAAFDKLPNDKEIIVHCYSAYCTLGRKVGKSLANNGIYVKELTVGWSELRYHWDIWNPGAKVTDGAGYIVKGTQTQDATILPAPCVEGEYGC